jgi:hypothetical protein
MRHTLLAATSLCICLGGLMCLAGNAQQVIDVANENAFTNVRQSVLSAASGQTFQPNKFVRVNSGSPFFKGQWFSAQLFDADGNRYTCPNVRLNLLDNEVNFLDATGTELINRTPIKQIQLTDTVSGSHYLFIRGDQIHEADKSEAHIWLQVLVNDKVSLCRQQKKTIHETIPYGTSTTEEDIFTIDIYFVRMKNSFIRVRSWQDFLQLFADKKVAVDQFVSAHHLKGKSEDDYTQLVQFYNSLGNA